MKKTILSLTLIVATLVLAACGSNNTTVVNVADSTQAVTDTTAVVDTVETVK